MDPLGEPLLVADKLGRRFGDRWAVRDLSFTVEKGEIFGLIGPNGAGKTTTIKMITGLLAPTEGAGAIAGRPITDPSLRARIGYLPEETPLYDDMTPVSYLRFFADIYGVPRADSARRTEELLSYLALEFRTEKKLGDLSKGQRRKVAIARSLLHDPDLLIYDEPASGLDPVASAHVLDLVRDLKKRGKTVIFSAHNLYHVERICDHITLLHHGAKVLGGTMEEIRAASGGTEYRVRLSIPIAGSTPVEGGHEVVAKRFEDVAKLAEAAEAEGGRLIDVRTSDLHLEEIFLRATSR